MAKIRVSVDLLPDHFTFIESLKSDTKKSRNQIIAEAIELLKITLNQE